MLFCDTSIIIHIFINLLRDSIASKFVHHTFACMMKTTHTHIILHHTKPSYFTLTSGGRVCVTFRTLLYIRHFHTETYIKTWSVSRTNLMSNNPTPSNSFPCFSIVVSGGSFLMVKWRTTDSSKLCSITTLQLAHKNATPFTSSNNFAQHIKDGG